jgi:hypothetical protein
MRKRICLLCIFCAVLFIGCVTTVSRPELDARIYDHATETINGVYYMGSKDGYNYIVNITTLRSKKYRIKDNELHIDNPFPLTRDKEKWRLLKGNSDIW